MVIALWIAVASIMILLLMKRESGSGVGYVAIVVLIILAYTAGYFRHGYRDWAACTAGTSLHAMQASGSIFREQ